MKKKPATKTGIPFMRGKSWVYYLRLPDGTGKTKTTLSKPFPSYEEALESSKILQESLKSTKNKTAITDKVSVYIEKWLKQVYYYKVCPSMYATTEKNARIYINPVIGGRRFASVTKNDVEKVLDSVIKEGKSASTVRSVFNTLRAVYTHAVNEGQIINSPCKGIKLPALSKPQRELVRKNELGEFLEMAKKYNIYLEVLLGITFGLREGEILGLKFKDFNARRATLIPVRSVKRGYVGNPLTEDKPRLGYIVSDKLESTKSQGRVLNLTPEMISFIKSLEEQYIKDGIATRGNIGECFIFHGETGDSFRAPDYLKNRFRRLRDEFGLPKLRFHDTRHTFATYLIEDGAPIASISNALGHASITTTYNSYFDEINSGKEIAAKIGSIINENLSTNFSNAPMNVHSNQPTNQSFNK